MADFPQHTPARWEFTRMESDEHRIRRVAGENLRREIDKTRNQTCGHWWTDQRYLDQNVPSNLTDPTTFDNFNYGYQMYARQPVQITPQNLSEVTDEIAPLRYNVKRVAIDKPCDLTSARCCDNIRLPPLPQSDPDPNTFQPGTSRCPQYVQDWQGPQTCSANNSGCYPAPCVGREVCCGAFSDAGSDVSASCTTANSMCCVQNVGQWVDDDNNFNNINYNSRSSSSKSTTINKNNNNNNNDINYKYNDYGNQVCCQHQSYTLNNNQHTMLQYHYPNGVDVLQTTGRGNSFAPKSNTSYKPVHIALEAYPVCHQQPLEHAPPCGNLHLQQGEPWGFLCRPKKGGTDFPPDRRLQGVRVSSDVDEDKKNVVCQRVYRTALSNTPENAYLDQTDPLVFCQVEAKPKKLTPGYGTYKIIGGRQYREAPDRNILDTMTLPEHLQKYVNYLRRCPDVKHGIYDRSNSRYELILPTSKTPVLISTRLSPFEYSRSNII